MYNSQIKLTIIITGLNTGGAEMMLLKLLERLSSKFSIEVISLTEVGVIGEKIQQLGLSVTALKIRQIIPNPSRLFQLVQILRKTKPDIVHTWMYHADFLGGIAARLAGIPIIIWNIRNSGLSKQKTKLTTRVIVNICAKLSYLIPNYIQCCSQVAQKTHQVIGYDTSKFIITPNGFDLDRFQPDFKMRISVREELGLNSKTKLVGLIGRFDPQKNHLGFFSTASYLHQKFTDIHFILAGQEVDESNKEITATVKKYNLQSCTHLLGRREDIPRLMAALDVLCSASSYGEAFPNVIGEAMACGVPCVVTDVGDSAYITGNTGKVVSPDDMISLAQSVELLLNLSSSEKQILSQQARQRVAENFEITEIVQQYESLYYEAVKSQEQ